MTLLDRLVRLRNLLRCVLDEPIAGGKASCFLSIPEAGFFTGAIVLGAEPPAQTRLRRRPARR